jgi:hypothetical protein
MFMMEKYLGHISGLHEGAHNNGEIFPCAFIGAFGEQAKHGRRFNEDELLVGKDWSPAMVSTVLSP